MKRPCNVYNENLVYWTKVFREAKIISESKVHSRFRAAQFDRGFSDLEINLLIRSKLNE